MPTVPATTASGGLDASNWSGTRGQTHVFMVLAPGVNGGVQVSTISEAKFYTTCRKS